MSVFKLNVSIYFNDVGYNKFRWNKQRKGIWRNKRKDSMITNKDELCVSLLHDSMESA